ncbi:MAG: heavy-metal-associated domain-containing protein [Clostridia bacterium]|nr:heavy-metal-associated domain-containing protein [Clostridia bacterium]
MKYILTIDGMACGMCEAHINNTVRNEVKVKNVKSSYKKGTTTIIADELNEQKLVEAINKTGYKVLSIKKEA